MFTFVKRIILLATILLFSYDTFAQVAKNIIVEHFTNTWCIFCTNRNPGFYENLNKQPGALHISFHPSRPYDKCELYKHNPAENDGRTHYYNVYGGTPRLVIQGEVVPNNMDYSNKAIFESHLDQTSPLSIALEQYKTEENLIEVKIWVTNEEEHTLTGVKIFAGVAEQLVQFDAQNGEKEHFDVFRKAYTNVEGELIRLDKKQGATKEFSYQLPVNDSWVLEELFSFVILQQEDTKAVIQAEISKAGEFSVPVHITEIEKILLHIFPNPAEDILHLTLPNKETSHLKIYDYTGKLWIQTTFNSDEKIDINLLSKGLYLVEVEQQGKFFQHKIIKK